MNSKGIIFRVHENMHILGIPADTPVLCFLMVQPHSLQTILSCGTDEIVFSSKQYLLLISKMTTTTKAQHSSIVTHYCLLTTLPQIVTCSWIMFG